MQDQHEARRVLLGDLPDMQSGFMPSEEAVYADMTGLQDAVRDLSDGSEAVLAAPGVGDEVIANLPCSAGGKPTPRATAPLSPCPEMPRTARRSQPE